MKVSVIIPVYKTEEFLKECIESVLSQSLEDMEIILIDDGSPDNCPHICDEYVVQYSHIKVIHKPNGGLSQARNYGIREARGEYILFLDSDDFWAEKDGLESLIKVADYYHCDVLNFQYQYFDNDKKIVSGPLKLIDADRMKGMDKAGEFEYLMNHSYYIACAWNKVIRRELLVTNDIYFQDGTTSEDIEWCARLAIYASSMKASNCSFYRYRQRQGSITHSIGYPALLQLKLNIEKCIEYNELLCFQEAFKGSYLSYVAYQYGTFFISCSRVRDDRVQGLLKEMKKYRYLFQYDTDPKVAMLHKVEKILGFSGVCFLSKIYGRIH